MEERRRNLRAMLAEAKDTSELMVDLAYAALYFGDPDMAEEVDELEETMSDLVHDMRAVCVLAARNPREADEMASVLQVISAIERIANAAVDIARIVTHRLGIPRELVADLSNAEEVSHRVRVRENSHLARRPLSDLELPVADRHARRRHPAGPGVDHRRRRRRWSARRATCCSCAARRPASTGCGSWRRRRGGSHRRRPRTAASPTSTAPSTSSSR